MDTTYICMQKRGMTVPYIWPSRPPSFQLGPVTKRFRDHRHSNKPYFIQPPANLPQTVYSQRALHSGVCLWQPDSVPHLLIRSHERLASSDSSSQHTDLCRSAFSLAAVSWTTSGDKRLPECLACRRFTRTQGWFILALHKQASVYISLVLAFKSTVGNIYTRALGHTFCSFTLSWASATHTYVHCPTPTDTHRWPLCLCSSASLGQTHTHTHTHTLQHAPLFMSEIGFMSVICLHLCRSCCALMQLHTSVLML